VTSRSAMEWRRWASLRTFCCCKDDWLTSFSSSGNWYRGCKMASNWQFLDSSTSYLLIEINFSTTSFLKQTALDVCTCGSAS
jgi:hypothetical protein